MIPFCFFLKLPVQQKINALLEAVTCTPAYLAHPKMEIWLLKLLLLDFRDEINISHRKGTDFAISSGTKLFSQFESLWASRFLNSQCRPECANMIKLTLAVKGQFASIINPTQNQCINVKYIQDEAHLMFQSEI